MSCQWSDPEYLPWQLCGCFCPLVHTEDQDSLSYRDTCSVSHRPLRDDMLAHIWLQERKQHSIFNLHVRSHPRMRSSIWLIRKGRKRRRKTVTRWWAEEYTSRIVTRQEVFLGAGTELNVQDVSTLRSRAHEKLLWSFEELALTKMSALSARGISTNSNSLPSGYGCMGGREAGLEKRDTGWSTSIATLR